MVGSGEEEVFHDCTVTGCSTLTRHLYCCIFYLRVCYDNTCSESVI